MARCMVCTESLDFNHAAIGLCKMHRFTFFTIADLDMLKQASTNVDNQQESILQNPLSQDNNEIRVFIPADEDMLQVLESVEDGVPVWNPESWYRGDFVEALDNYRQTNWSQILEGFMKLYER